MENKTNRTLWKLQAYNSAQKCHWQLICDLSDNDYDIRYFGGRELINDNFQEVLQEQNTDNFDINNLLVWLNDELEKEVYNQQEFYNENKYYSVSTQGYVDELNLLIKIVKQEY